MARHVKYAVFLNYVFVKRWLSKAFPFLFPLDDEPEEKRNSPAAPSVNWLDIFDAFVGDDVAVMEKYQAMPVATAFRLLNKRIRDTRRMMKYTSSHQNERSIRHWTACSTIRQ